MVNGGWPEEDAWAALIDPTNRGGLYLQDRHRHNATAARSTFRKEFAKAASFVASNPIHDPQAASLDLVAIRQAVEDRPDLFSAGLAGVTERALVRALVERGLSRSSRIVRVSMRQLAEDVDVRPDTVSKALKRLTNGGDFVRIFEAGALNRATSYSLVLPAARVTVTGGLDPRVPAELAVTVVGARVHRLFGANGLPLGALETYARIPAREPLREVPAGGGSPARGEHHGVGPDVEVSAKPTGRRPRPRRRGTQDDSQQVRQLPPAPTCTPPTAAELARWTGRPASTVMRHLRRMERWGLVHQDSFGRWERLAVDPDVLADQLGVVDAVPRKQARHRRERLGYLDALVRRGQLVQQRDDGVLRYVNRVSGEVVAELNEHEVRGNLAVRGAV